MHVVSDLFEINGCKFCETATLPTLYVTDPQTVISLNVVFGQVKSATDRQAKREKNAYLWLTQFPAKNVFELYPFEKLELSTLFAGDELGSCSFVGSESPCSLGNYFEESVSPGKKSAHL